MHIVASSYRRESERITDNLIEVVDEIRDKYAARVAPRRNPPESSNQASSSQRTDRTANALE
eukprot:7433063-Karenia_brevis.AAC.1